MIKIKYLSIVSCIVPVLTFGNSNKIALLNNAFPPDLYIVGSNFNPSVNITYPGLLGEPFSTKMTIGYLKQVDSSKTYMWQPRTSYDQDRSNGYYSPYIFSQISNIKIQTGLYLGNVVSDFNEHNRSSLLDTVNNFNKGEIAMDGSVWATGDLGVLKGISFLYKGNYLNRNLHFQNSGDWKSLHTIFNYKQKTGYGILTGLFSFMDMNYFCARIEYGLNVISATEKQLDTLYFSTNSYVSSNLALDSSYTASLFGCHLDYLFQSKTASGALLSGIKVGANRSNIDFHGTSGDSTKVYLSGFVQKMIVFDGLTIFTGLNITYAPIFYSKSSTRLGYLDLAGRYSWAKRCNNFSVTLPIVSKFKIGSHFEIFGGAQLKYRNTNSNYNFYNDLLNNTSNSQYVIEFLPIGFRYNSNNHINISCTPSFDKNIIASGFEISYEF